MSPNRGTNSEIKRPKEFDDTDSSTKKAKSEHELQTDSTNGKASCTNVLSEKIEKSEDRYFAIEADAAEDKGSRRTMEDAWVVLHDASLESPGNLRFIGWCAVSSRHSRSLLSDMTGPHVDDRTLIWVEDGIFQPDHNKVVKFITRQFSLQTCDEGYSWKFVTAEQRQWYWDEFVKRYTWTEDMGDTIRQIWYKNVSTQYRRTIHHWRSADRHPQTVPADRWAAWTAAWHEEGWLARAAQNKENRNSEPAGPGTGTTKHIAGSKMYSAHSHTLQPMETYMDESLTPLDDGMIPGVPSSEEVNSVFKNVIGGQKKGRIYGCGSMASTIYPDEMAPRKRGGPSSSSRGSQATEQMREEWENQRKVNELLRIDLKATQSTLQATQSTLQATQQENSSLKDRMTLLEEQVSRLVAALPQGPPVQPSRRVLYGRESSGRGRFVAGSSRDDPFAAGSSRSRPSGKVLRYSPEYVPPSQDFGHDDGDEDDDEDDEEDYDDDETEAP